MVALFMVWLQIGIAIALYFGRKTRRLEQTDLKAAWKCVPVFLGYEVAWFAFCFGLANLLF